MKQWYKNVKMLLLLPLAFLMVNCSGKSDNNNNANNYYYSNGMCYNRSNGSPANASYCNGLAGQGGYYMANGQCYSSLNGQPAPITACQMGGGGMGQVCIGYYTYPANGTSGYCQQPDYTGRNNCSGYMMMNQQGMQVNCL